MAEPRGLVADIRAAWGDPGGSIRAKIAAKPPESQLLVWLYVACGLGFVAGLPGAYRQAAGLTEESALAGVITGRLIAALFFAPLFLYGLAAASRLVARAFGGQGSYYSARLALIWALVVSIPLVIASGLATAALGSWSGAQAVFQGLTTLGFLWIWSVFISICEYIGTPPRVFLVVLALLLSILGTLLLIRLV